MNECQHVRPCADLGDPCHPHSAILDEDLVGPDYSLDASALREHEAFVRRALMDPAGIPAVLTL